MGMVLVMVLVAVLGFLDMIFGVALSASLLASLSGNGLIFMFGVLAILKGAYSVIAAIFAGFYFDIMGWLDLAVGAMLMFVSWGIVFPFFLYFGLLLIAKGIYSMFVGLVASQE